MTEIVNVRNTGCEEYIGRGNGGEAHMNNTPVGERGWIGNPYTTAEYPREMAIELFRRDFEDRTQNDSEFRQAVEGLRGNNLGCYCRPQPCHGDVILAYLGETASRSVLEI